ncbi:MAG TPA: hypothetical protein VI197_11840, partial [Polyangiaceae bacterium]
MISRFAALTVAMLAFLPVRAHGQTEPVPADQAGGAPLPQSPRPASQGQYPPGPPPSGQYSPGQPPPGPPTQHPAGQPPPGQYPPGQYPPGQYPSGQYPSGQYPSGQPPPVQYPAGQYPPGQYSQGQYPPPGQYPPAPPGQYSPPLPPAPEDDPEWHNHDGFYFRLSLPIGYQATRFRFDESSGRESFSVSGPAVGFELRLGGTITEGLAIGLQMYSSSARREDAPLRYEDELDDTPDDQGDETVVIAQCGLLGFFVDYFPQSRENFHFGASLGLASVVIDHDRESDPKLDEASGLGASGWVGYGWWISKNWSGGGLLQVTG